MLSNHILYYASQTIFLLLSFILIVALIATTQSSPSNRKQEIPINYLEVWLPFVTVLIISLIVCLLRCNAMNLSATFLIYCTNIFTSKVCSQRSELPLFFSIFVFFIVSLFFNFFSTFIDFKIKEKTNQPQVPEDLKPEQMWTQKSTY